LSPAKIRSISRAAWCAWPAKISGLPNPALIAATLAAKEAFDFLGAPEGHLALAQAAVYLSLAPKSNAVYTAYGEVIDDVHKTEAEPVPLHIRNAVTGLMKNIGLRQRLQVRP